MVQISEKDFETIKTELGRAYDGACRVCRNAGRYLYVFTAFGQDS